MTLNSRAVVDIYCSDKASNEQFLFETYLTLKPFFRIIHKYKTQFLSETQRYNGEKDRPELIDELGILAIASWLLVFFFWLSDIIHPQNPR